MSILVIPAKRVSHSLWLLMPAHAQSVSRGNPREGATGTRVPHRQPRGLAAPGGRETSSGPLRVLRDLAVPGGCLTAPACGDLCPAASFGVPLSRFGLEPFGRSPARRPLLVLCRKRSQRASWISSHPSLPSRRRSLAREGRMRISRPVATSDARIITRRGESGDKPRFVQRVRMVNCDGLVLAMRSRHCHCHARTKRVHCLQQRVAFCLHLQLVK